MKATSQYKLHLTLLLFLLFFTSCAYLQRDSQKSNKLKTRASPRDARVVYVAIGDSTGLGLGARDGGGYVDLLLVRIQQAHPGSRLINLARGWATTADVLSKDLKRFPADQATLVTVSIGLNDLMQGVSDEQFARNYEEMISGLEKTGVPIIVTNLPDISLAPAISESQREEVTRGVALFNKRIEQIAARHKLPLIDLYQISNAAVQSHPDSFSRDGLHPSDVGYALWAEGMWPTVENTINK